MTRRDFFGQAYLPGAVAGVEPGAARQVGDDDSSAVRASVIYLRSFDRYADILRYEPATGSFQKLTRSAWEALGVPLGCGAFISDGERVAGVYGSSEGPVIFVNGHRVTARFGTHAARLDAVDGLKLWWFVLLENGEPVLRFEYEERFGLGVNPYDNEPEDIDLMAMIAAGLRSPQFYRTYTLAVD